MRHQIECDTSANAPGWLAGGGEMGELIRAIDWRETPLGPVSGWSRELRTMARVLQQAASARRAEASAGAALDLLRPDREAALRESEERFRALVTASSDVVYRMSPDWSEMRYLRGRDFLADTEEPSATWLRKYIHPDDQPRVTAVIDEAIRTRSVFELEHRVLRADGSLGWTFSRAIPLLGAGGEITEWFGMARDITQRKRSEEALRESEARFRSVLDSSRDVIYRLNVQTGRFEYISPSCEAVVGCSVEELMALGSPAVLEMIHPEEQASMRAALAAVEATGRGEVEYRQRTKSGEYRWMSNRMSLVRDGAGRPLYRDGSLRDITEQKQAVDALRASEEEYRHIVECAPTGIYEIDYRSPRFRRVNDAMCRILGYTRDEMFALNPLDLLDEEGRALFQERVRRVLAGRPVDETVAFRVFGKDGRAIWSELNVKLLFAGGKLDGALVVAHDITERKRAEDAAAAANQELQEADRRKDEFLAMLGHELRNPLAAISGAVQLMGMPGADGPVLACARDAAERQARHMVRLVDDLLDVSRITQGKITLKQEKVALADVIDSAVDGARPAIDAAGHRLFVSLPGEPLHVIGDPVRLAQVVGNLLNNAAKYTPAGGEIHLSVESVGAWQRGGRECEPRPAPLPPHSRTPTLPRSAVIRVRDNGLGIAPELLPHVFDLFVQGERGLDRSQGGLGIGLTMAKRLAEMHGGRIEAESDGPGRGSEFALTLPLTSPESAGARTPGRGAGASRRILVVDDTADVAEMLAMVLEAWGHEVVVAHSGKAALDLAASYHPEVVLLDLGMPVMDGFEVARRLREQPSPAGTMLVALTGYGQEEDREQTRDAGFAHHLVKPVEAAELRRVLAEARG